MTTAVIVEANHGWPVRVTHIARALVGGATTETESVVAAGDRATFFVYESCDLLVHEIQPHELPPPPPDE